MLHIHPFLKRDRHILAAPPVKDCSSKHLAMCASQLHLLYPVFAALSHVGTVADRVTSKRRMSVLVTRQQTQRLSVTVGERSGGNCHA